MENKDKEIIKIGDLIKLNVKNITKYNRHKIFDFGIVLDKILKLHILQNAVPFKENDISVSQHTIQTSICKVYWFNTNKTDWEYENDLQILAIKTSNS